MPRTKSKYAEVTPKQTPAEPLPRFMGTGTAAKYSDLSPISFWRWALRAERDGLLNIDRTTRPFRFDRLQLDSAFAARAGKAVA